jgi:hypothetical protein
VDFFEELKGLVAGLECAGVDYALCGGVADIERLLELSRG